MSQEKECKFHSLCTVVPPATQLLGVKNPLFGGQSPYSVISVLTLIEDPRLCQLLLDWNERGMSQRYGRPADAHD